MSTTIPSNKQIAMTIIDQLGGMKFLTMTGTTQLVYDHNSVIMKLRRNKIGATNLRITLNSMDTYDMCFLRVRYKDGCDTRTTLKEYNGVYNDMLQDIFTETTGLYTHL